jgi:hypothetical protein
LGSDAEFRHESVSGPDVDRNSVSDPDFASMGQSAEGKMAAFFDLTVKVRIK